MKKSTLLVSLIALTGLYACETAKQQETSTTATPTSVRSSVEKEVVMEKNGIRLFSYKGSPDYPEARIRLAYPGADNYLPAGEVEFNYELTGFPLGKQTLDAAHKGCANSEQGQHIHNIVDNEPYTAHYETKFKKEITEGEHIVLSFISRSYHESLKTPQAYDLRIINVGKPASKGKYDLKAPHLFYSRPKGEYVGADAKAILLDFYLVNTSLSEGGNKVKATINGTEFLLASWNPYMIEGLPMGENYVRLELVDGNGNIIPGPFNTVERKFVLKEKETVN